MNDHDFIESILKEVLDVIKPTREHFVSRFTVMREIQEVVSSVDDLRNATVEPFGSFVANLFSRWGDLDISIEIPNGLHISATGKKRKLNLLTEVLAALRKKGAFRKIKFYSNARVPILKFESKLHMISCDLSVDNLVGQMKSKFLFWISELDGRFRDMVLLVKEWAQAHNINDPKSGTLNSYSLCLLVIFHFQTCVPAILPPLRDLYSKNMADELYGERAQAERQIAETCAANIARLKNNKSREVNRSTLCELFVSFLAKFSDIGTNAEHLGISTYAGRWDEINNNAGWLPKTYAIFIEDPFERPLNSARAVSLRQMANITEAFRRTRYSLVSVHQSKTSILTSISRPQVFRCLVRPPVMYPNHSNAHNNSNAQFQRVPWHRAQNGKQGNRSQDLATPRQQSQNGKQGNRSQDLATSRQPPKNSQGPQRPMQKNMWRRKSEPA